jgi:hypothetical protein
VPLPKRRRLLLFFLFFTLGFVPAQEGESAAGETGTVYTEGSAETDGETVYYIKEINFAVTGNTREFALLYVADLRKGERINGKDNLEKYLSDKTRILNNQRVLEEARIDFNTGDPDPDGLVPVYLLVSVKDTWNMIAVPWFQYDSNSGIEASIKARDYSFLGTMSPLRVDLGYESKDHLVYNPFYQSYEYQSRGTFFLNLDSNIPFMAFGLRWDLNFDNNFAFTWPGPFQYRNTTGLSVYIPVKRSFLSFGFQQHYILNEENADEDKLIYENGQLVRFEEYFTDKWYLASEGFTQWSIPTGLEYKELGELTIIPRIGILHNYRPWGEIGDLRKGPILTGTGVLTFGRIDWVGNFRKGLNLSVTGASAYNFHKSWASAWSNTLIAAATGHLPLHRRFGISGRLQYRHWFNDTADAGDVLRGIKNNSVVGDYMLSLNLDFPFLFKQFYVSEMLFSRHLRYFNFDMHFSPFVDIALIHDPTKGRPSFSYRDFFVSGGLEIMVFPHAMRSIYMRASAGVNLIHYFSTKDIPTGKNRELFIGFGHHY